jgi:membrane protein YqaA with SNARE-associated domain
MPTEPPDSPSVGNKSIVASRKRTVLVLFEAFLVLVLAFFFLYSKFVLSRDIDTRTNLVVLFLYAFPSEFLVGLIPHEPALLHYGTVYSAWVVALVSVVSTVMAEGLNYSFFDLFYRMPGFRAGLQKKGVKKVTDWFNRMPFAAIVFCGATPVPFFPVRFLVVITEYSRWKYLLGVFISRAPRFYLLAWLGKVFEFSNAFLIIVFVGMLVFVNIPAAVKMFSGPREPTTS